MTIQKYDWVSIQSLMQMGEVTL